MFLATSSSSPGASLSFYYIAIVAEYVLVTFPLWRLAKFNDDPNAWVAWVPLANLTTVMKLARLNPWLALIVAVPLVGGIFLIVTYFRIPATFGRSTGWGVALWLLNFIGWYIFAFTTRRVEPPPATDTWDDRRRP